MVQRVVMLMPSAQGEAALIALLADGYSPSEVADDVDRLVEANVAGMVDGTPELWTDFAAEKLLVVDGLDQVSANLKKVFQGASHRDIEIRTSQAFANAYNYIQSGFRPVNIADVLEISQVNVSTAKQAKYAGPNRMYCHFPKMDGGSASWGPELLIYPDAVSLRSDGATRIDVTGRARTIAYGPYITLVPGRWRLDAVIDVEAQAGVLDLNLEWGSGDEFDVSECCFETAGAYSISIDHDWKVVGACEFRLKTSRPHFDGVINIVSLNVTYVAPPDQKSL